MRIRHDSTFVRLGVAALLAGPIGIGLLAAGTPAGATTDLPFDTKFEIDGNPQVNSTGDWLSTATQYPELRDNFVTTTEPCGAGIDPNRFIPGTKLDEINVNNASSFIQPGNVLTKGDICAVRRAWELVLVPEDPADPAAGGQYHFISYLAWSRVTTQGEINVLVPLLGADPNSQTDDVIVNYDFDDNTGLTTLSFLKWNATTSTWDDNPLLPGTYEAFTATGVTDPAVPAPQGNNLTFGEYAIDLTAAGLIPENGPCASFSNGALASRTGNSSEATLEDAVALPPLTLTNCSSLNIVKQTTPTPTSATAFGYRVSEVDGAQVQPGITQLNGSITVPPNPNTVTISNLLISPDYVVSETSLPAGWTEQSLVCTSFDPISGQPVTRTLYNGTPGPDASFPLGPNVAATCTITNVGPPRVDVTKTIQGTTAAWSFDFTISPVPPGETATKTATNLAPTVSWDGLVAGTAYTITEAAEPGFISGVVDCDGDATFTPAPGETVTCAVTNTELASVDVTKTVAGPAATWSFDFTINPVPAGETSTKTATNAAATVGWDGLVPGTAYTITEANVAGFVTGTLTCTGGTSGAGTSTFTPTAGQAVTCAITNDVVVQLPPPIADIAVVKTAAPTVVTPGGNVTWTLTARNNGPDPADNATIVDNLPTSLTLVSFTSPAGWDCSGTVTGNPGKLSCTKPTMGVNESATFTLTTTVAAAAAGTSIDNTAVVSTTTNETTTSNNQDAEPISVQQAVLPPTGGYVWNLVAIAAAFVLAGVALLAIERRRRLTS